MVRKLALVVGLAAFAVSVAGSPALAKCSKVCVKAIVSEAKTCAKACPKGKAGKQCKKACTAEKKADTKACKAATNPTPPGCGEASPSGAFLR